MKILFTWIQTDALQPWEGAPYIESMKRFLSLGEGPQHELVNTAEDADLIIYFESVCYKDKAYAKLLLSQRALQLYPEKCFTVNQDDYPLGFLPGVYACMENQNMECQRFRAGLFMGAVNPCVSALANDRAHEPEFLFSFRGARSSRVRNLIFEFKPLLKENAVIQESNKWFNHTTNEQEIYAREILNSKFALCPRGIGTATHRLFEVMELGRVPVILSDRWVPPDGPDWGAFSLRVPESKVRDLPKIIRSYENRSCEMGRLARAAWEKWFAPNVRLKTVLNYIKDIKLQRSYDERAYQRKWLSWAFYNKYGRTPSHGVIRRLRNGSFLSALKSKAEKARSVFR